MYPILDPGKGSKADPKLKDYEKSLSSGNEDKMPKLKDYEKSGTDFVYTSRKLQVFSAVLTGVCCQLKTGLGAQQVWRVQKKEQQNSENLINVIKTTKPRTMAATTNQRMTKKICEAGER